MSTRASRRGRLIVLAAAVAACRGSGSEPSPSPSSSPSTESAAAAASDKPYAVALSFHRTTSPETTIRNLESRIDTLARSADRRAHKTTWHAELVSLLHERASALGHVQDYRRALERAEQFVARAPERPGAYLVRAQALARIHRFAAAAADLDRAQELGASASNLARQRASLLLATGELDQARALYEAQAARGNSFQPVTTLGVILAELGEYDRAEALFRQAMESLRNPSPLPFAWLCFQWGRLYERRGDPGAARELYEIAYDRMPQYVEATGHLAALVADTGDHARAAALLRPLVRDSDNPEYVGQLAEVEAARGDRAAAAELAARARDTYEALLAQMPEAFADHAARFYLAAGHDPARAHALARVNLGVRKTAAAYQLAIEAALSAGESAQACTDASAAVKLAHVPRELQFAAWRAYSGCGDADRAAQLARVLGIAD